MPLTKRLQIIDRVEDGKSLEGSMKVEEYKNAEAEPTYKMRPDQIFNASDIKETMEKILKKVLENQTYDTKTVPVLSVAVSDEIKREVKEMGYTRYKLICHTTIFSGKKRSLTVASRFLWDTNVDNYVTVEFKGQGFYAISTLFGIYYE